MLLACGARFHQPVLRPFVSEVYGCGWVCRGEIWSLDVDPAERRVATGSTDNELRLYSVAEPDAEGATMQWLRPTEPFSRGRHGHSCFAWVACSLRQECGISHGHAMIIRAVHRTAPVAAHTVMQAVHRECLYLSQVGNRAQAYGALVQALRPDRARPLRRSAAYSGRRRSALRQYSGTLRAVYWRARAPAAASSCSGQWPLQMTCPAQQGQPSHMLANEKLDGTLTTCHLAAAVPFRAVAERVWDSGTNPSCFAPFWEGKVLQHRVLSHALP